jgi:hypothetical protein
MSSDDRRENEGQAETSVFEEVIVAGAQKMTQDQIVIARDSSVNGGRSGLPLNLINLPGQMVK